MSHKRLLILTSCLAVFLLVGCECTKGPQGKYDENVIGTAHRVSIAADGTVTKIETLMGGNWEKLTPAPDDSGKGDKILDIKVFKHDGSTKGLIDTDGTTYGKSLHPHTGGQNPPWNSHCHYVWYVGGQKFTSHCSS